MWLCISVPLLASLNTVLSRTDVGKTWRTVPYITNSLVNHGKIDISFHISAHPGESEYDAGSHGSRSLFPPKIETSLEEPCPCSTSLTYLKDFSRNHPSDILNKVLSGNDLFSFKEPTSSLACCDSHERAQKEILLEFGPKHNEITGNRQTTSNLFPFLPFLLDGLENRATVPTVRPKQMEIFFFPKKRGVIPVNFNKIAVKKDDKKDMKIVGDKTTINDLKNQSFTSAAPPSVKIDSVVQDRNKYETKMVQEVKSAVADRHFNFVN